MPSVTARCHHTNILSAIFPARKSLSKPKPMKKTGLFAASVAAASATALSSPPSSSSTTNSAIKTSGSFAHQQEKRNEDENSQRRSSSKDQFDFAPKFDGLRFIETLITAHR